MVAGPCLALLDPVTVSGRLLGLRGRRASFHQPTRSPILEDQPASLRQDGAGSILVANAVPGVKARWHGPESSSSDALKPITPDRSPPGQLKIRCIRAAGVAGEN